MADEPWGESPLFIPGSLTPQRRRAEGKLTKWDGCEPEQLKACMDAAVDVCRWLAWAKIREADPRVAAAIERLKGRIEAMTGFEIPEFS